MNASPARAKRTLMENGLKAGFHCSSQSVALDSRVHIYMAMLASQYHVCCKTKSSSVATFMTSILIFMLYRYSSCRLVDVLVICDEPYGRNASW